MLVNCGNGRRACASEDPVGKPAYGTLKPAAWGFPDAKVDDRSARFAGFERLSRGQPELCGRQSVQVVQVVGLQPDAPIAYIGGLQHEVLRELALQTNIPLIDARRPAAVRIDPVRRAIELPGERNDSGA